MTKGTPNIVTDGQHLFIWSNSQCFLKGHCIFKYEKTRLYLANNFVDSTIKLL